MKVLSIGSDRSLFHDLNTLNRVKEYSSRVDSYSVIVFSKKSLGLTVKSESNLNLFPTNSLNRLLYVFDAVLLARKILHKENKLNDWVITVQDPFEAGLVGFIVKLFYKLPLQIQVHTDFLSDKFSGGFLNKIRLIISSLVIKKADGIRVVSSVIKDSLIKKYPTLEDKVEVLPIFVDINSILDFIPQKNIKLEFPNFDFIILMASRLSPEKRIDVAISSLDKILKIYPKTGLIICGTGPEKNKLTDMAFRSGVGNNVVFKEWQSDLISYFKTTDLYLLTSEFEGYGMTLIEAGASGAAIVSTSVGVAKTDIFKNGFNVSICRELTPTCVADEVMAIISDEELRRKYKENVKIAISNLAITREEYVDKYIRLLKGLIK